MDYLRQIVQQRHRDSLEYFFRAAWKVIEPDTPLHWNWHMTYISHQLEGILHMVRKREKRTQDTVFNVPPATTKSTLITVVFPVWCWLWEPRLKFLTLSYAETLAIAHAVKSRDIIQSDWFRGLFSDVFQLKFDVNKKSEYANDHSGIRVAVGVGGAATGKHGDIIICDDPTNPKQAESLMRLEDVNNWWDKTIYNRMTDANTTQKIIVMQRLATNDLSGHVLGTKENEYRSICIPAEVSPNIHPPELAQHYQDGVMDAVRLGKEALYRFRLALGSHGYSGQYMQNPIAEEGNLVKPEWFGMFTLDKMHRQAYEDRLPVVWNLFIDGAYTEKHVNDPTALLCAAHWQNNLYIRDVTRVWMELPELVKFIPDFALRNLLTDESRIFVEPKASGLSIVQTLRRYTRLNVVADKPPKADKVQRLKQHLPFIEAQRVFLLEGAAWVPVFLDEVKAFPFGQHDDITDCLTMACSRTEHSVEAGSILGIGIV